MSTRWCGDSGRLPARRLLEGFGYTARYCTTGDEALRLFDRVHGLVALVMLDLAMPDMAGGEVYDGLLQIDPAAKVLVVSGLADSSRARAILSRGAAGYLQKPYDAATLRQTIESLLSEL